MTTHRDVTKPPIRAFASAEYLRDFYEFSFRFDRKHFDTALSNLISIDQLVLEDPEDAETLLVQLLQITKEIKARASNKPQIQSGNCGSAAELREEANHHPITPSPHRITTP